MLECSVCHAKGGGLGGAVLYKLDGKFYCRSCLTKLMGQIKCAKCGISIFATNDSFQTIDGQRYCKSCAEASARARTAPPPVPARPYAATAPAPSFAAAGAPPRSAAFAGAAAGSTAGTGAGAGATSGQLPVNQLIGVLKQLYVENIKPTEQVRFALAGSAGEALVATDTRLLILKSGLATGQATSMVTSIPLSLCSDVVVVKETAHGYFGVLAAGYPDVRKVDYVTARRAPNAVSFLLDAWPAYAQAVAAVRARLITSSWRVA